MSPDPQDIIQIGDRLLKQHPESFSAQFERNKHIVKNLTNVGSLRLQNRVAGYITRQKAGR